MNLHDPSLLLTIKAKNLKQKIALYLGISISLGLFLVLFSLSLLALILMSLSLSLCGLIFYQRFFYHDDLKIDLQNKELCIQTNPTVLPSDSNNIKRLKLADIKSIEIIQSQENTSNLYTLVAYFIDPDKDHSETLKIEPNKSKKSKKKKKKKKKNSQAQKQQTSSEKQIQSAKQPQRISICTPTRDDTALKSIKSQFEDIVNFSITSEQRETGEDKKRSVRTTYSKQFLIPALVIFFGVQSWVAGSYYLGDYPWDERFSWRMFSTVRSLSCQTQMWRTEASGGPCPDGNSFGCSTVRMSRHYHMVWVNLLKRGRLQVLDQIAARECTNLKGQGKVFFDLSCPSPTPPHELIKVQSPLVDLCTHPQKRKP